MKKYIVKRPEVHIAELEVLANSKNDAIEKVRENFFDEDVCKEIDHYYSHALDESLWSVQTEEESRKEMEEEYPYLKGE